MSNPQDQTRPGLARELELNRVLSLKVTDREVAEHEVAGLKDAWTLAGTVQLESDLTPGEASEMRRRLLGRSGSSRVGPFLSSPARPGHSGPRISGRFWVSLAAATVVLMAMTAYLGARPTLHLAPVGSVTVVELRDGTRIELSPGSSLQEPGWLRAGRSVRLSGDAFFDVPKAPDTFTVTTQQAVITVLGTRFAVRSWPSETQTSVYLEEGRVRIASAGETSGSHLVMEPGQSVSVARSSVSIDPDFSAAAALDWRTGDFVFVNAPLGRVLDDIGRRFGVRVSRGPGVTEDRMVNGAFRGRSAPASVLSDLSLSLGLNYRETSDGFEVFRP